MAGMAVRCSCCGPFYLNEEWKMKKEARTARFSSLLLFVTGAAELTHTLDLFICISPLSVCRYAAARALGGLVLRRGRVCSGGVLPCSIPVPVCQ